MKWHTTWVCQGRNEADFVSFVICTSLRIRDLNTQGTYPVFEFFRNLPDLIRSAYRELAKLLEDGPKRDLKARYEFWPG